MVIAVDFDGTIVEHRYPEIGKEKPFAIDCLKALAAQGNQLILYTVREGELLEQALSFCKERGLTFYSVNSNYPNGWQFSADTGIAPKVLADVYIDDRNFGGLPDWETIYAELTGNHSPRHKKTPWWKRLLR